MRRPSGSKALAGARVDAGQVSPEVYSRLGLGIQPASSQAPAKAPDVTPASAGLPSNMSASAPFSTAVATTVAKGFNEADLMGDWDGKEDDTADHGGKILDSSNLPPAGSDPSFFLTRVAISEHTIANGFAEDISYHGDSLGNVYVASSTNLTAAAFITQYPLSQTAGTYVDALFASAGVFPTAGERSAAITAFGAGGTGGRAAALQNVADSNSVKQADLNASLC